MPLFDEPTRGSTSGAKAELFKLMGAGGGWAGDRPDQLVSAGADQRATGSSCCATAGPWRDEPPRV